MEVVTNIRHGRWLYIAEQHGHEAVVQKLVVVWADVNEATDTCTTLLYIAAQEVTTSGALVKTHENVRCVGCDTFRTHAQTATQTDELESQTLLVID